MNFIEVGLSFLEGLALIASPCILPILPLILSTSVDSGKRRPFGIITGFILSFTIFALLSRELVAILHINLDYIKYGSLILLTMFGIIMIFESLANRFSGWTQRFATQGSTLSANSKDGYLGGVLIGSLIGLVWTPCAGPILAVALVQIIRQQNNLNAVFLILAFAVGAGIPMLIISLTGRQLMLKLKFLSTHAHVVRKLLGVIILISVAFIAFSGNVQAWFSSAKNAQNAKVQFATSLQNPLIHPYHAPEFAASNVWLNTPDGKPITMSSLKGKVVLVDFWTYSCINCIRTLPYINAWYSKYHDKGLVIIGVHSPEFEFEKNKANVLQAISSDGIKYPVAMDNNLDTWSNFNNQYWPAHYLIDKNGDVVYTHFGEGDYLETENNIRVLLGLNPTDSNETNNMSLNQSQTPETYLGYTRASSFANKGDARSDISSIYEFPDYLSMNEWALSGKWLISGQCITSEAANTKLELRFDARHVYLVLGTVDKNPIDLTLKLNGKPVGVLAGKDVVNGIVKVNENRLYELIDQGNPASGLLEISIPKPGLEAYAFTFG